MIRAPIRSTVDIPSQVLLCCQSITTQEDTQLGGSYPSNRAAGVAYRPSPDFPGVRPLDPARPRRRLPRVRPLKPFRPGVKFPNPWKPPTKPFGRLPPMVFPNPLDRSLGKYLPWGLAVLPIIWAASRPQISSPAGWSVCWDYGGIQSLRSGPIRAYCPGDSYRLLSLQVPSGFSADPVTITSPNLAQALFYGPPVNVDQTRMQYRKMVARPDIPTSSPLYPYPTTTIKLIPQIAIAPNVWMDPDPNWWFPFDPEPHFPLPRPRVWPRPGPGTYPAPENGPSPVVVPPTLEHPDIDVTPEGVRPKPPHRRRPPDPRTREGKYRAKGAYATLAAYLLKLSAGTFGGITEAVDLISAIYAALPAELIARQPDLARKDLIPHMLGMIARHYKTIDLGEALENIARNQIEDWVWGKYFKAVDLASRQGPYYNGFDRELGHLNDLMRELMP